MKNGNPMKILVACEESQAITKELRALGHIAFSCDLQECSGGHPEWHFNRDVFEIIDLGWDMMIAHPPCTYLSVSGLHWNKKDPVRAQKTEDGLKFVQRLMDSDIPKIAIENPVSCISSRIRKPEQIVNPYQFGDDASKKTCLWLKGLPKLEPTEYVEPRMVDGKKRWGNQTDDGQNFMLDENGKVMGWNTDAIKKARSKTFPGLAKAIAEQWAGDVSIGDSNFWEKSSCSCEDDFKLE